MASPSPVPPLLPLTPQDEERILAGIDRFVELVQNVARITPGDGEDTPELADRLISWWDKLPADSKKQPRPTFEDLSWAIGCAVGDLLYHVLEVRWKKIHEGGKTHFCLHGQKPGKGTAVAILITPIDDVVDHWPEGENRSPHPIAEYLDELYEDETIRGFIAEGQD